MSTPLHGSFDLWYPHLFDKIIHAASPEARASLRLVSRNVRTRIDAWYPPHVVITYHHTRGVLLVTTPSSSAAPVTLYQIDKLAYVAVDRLPSTPYFPALIEALYENEKCYAWLSMARILDLDLDFWGHDTVERFKIEDKLHKIMPLLKAVRYHDIRWKCGRSEPLPSLPLTVGFIRSSARWDYYGRSHVRDDSPKYVLNIVEVEEKPGIPEGLIVQFPPTHEQRGQWTYHLDALATRTSVYGRDRTEIGQFVVTVPASFWHRFVKPSPISLLSSLCWHVFSLLAGFCPWLEPTIVIRLDDHVTPTTENDNNRRVVEKVTDEELACMKAAVKEDMMVILSELEFQWTFMDDKVRRHIRRRVERVRLLTTNEYKALVGDSVFAIETKM